MIEISLSEPLVLSENNAHVPCEVMQSKETLAAWIMDHYRPALQELLHIKLVVHTTTEEKEEEESSVWVEEEEEQEEKKDTRTSLGEHHHHHYLDDNQDGPLSPPPPHSLYNNNKNNNNDSLSTASHKKLEILDCIAEAQRMFLQRLPLSDIFQCILAVILRLQENQFAYIGEIIPPNSDDNDNDGDHHGNDDDDDNNVNTTTHSLRAFCRARTQPEAFQFQHPMHVQFDNWDNLFGYAICHKQVVISNDARNDPRASGRTPPGHIPLDNFLGIPLLNDTQDVIGMLGVANRPGGYSDADVKLLEAFSLTCSTMIQADQQRQQNKKFMRNLERKVQERTQKLQQMNAELEAANKRVVQASQAQLQHFACMSHEIRT